jgi:hypothetical protein
VALGPPLGGPRVTQTQTQSAEGRKPSKAARRHDRRGSNCHRPCRRPKAGALSAVEGERHSRESNDLDQAKPHRHWPIANC